jgi:hypothetical protein
MGIDFVPVWVWLSASALLLALYPVQSWADAPVFPTPRDALTGTTPALLGLPRFDPAQIIPED